MYRVSLLFTVMVSLWPLSVRASVSGRDSTVTGSIDEVVVTGTRERIRAEELPMTVTVVGTKAISSRLEPALLSVVSERVPGFFNTSRSVMGYGISTGAAGGMNIRGVGGMNSAQVLVLIDGHPHYSGLMGHPLADICQSAFVERVEVVRGPASVLYGTNAMGGVMNIITKKYRDHGSHTSVRMGGGSYGTLQTWVSNSSAFDGFESSVQFLFNKSDGHRDNMGFEDIQANVSLGYNISDNLKFSALINTARVKSENPGPVSEPLFNNHANIKRTTVTVSLENSFERAQGAVMVFSNMGDHAIADGNTAFEDPLDYDFRSNDKLKGLNVYENFYLSEGSSICVGADYFHTYGKGWFKHADGTLSSPWSKSVPPVEESSKEVAAYMSVRQRVARNVWFNGGLRYNHHSVVGGELVPQTGVVVDAARYGNFKLMVGKGYRNPTFKDLYLFPPQNPDLAPEKLINYELSYSNSFMDGRLFATAALFYIDAKNIITTQPVDGRKRNLNSGTLKNSGFELTCDFKLSDHLDLNANYSLLHMKTPVLAAPEHKAYVELESLYGKFNVTTSLQYVGGLHTSVTPGSERKEQYLLWNVRSTYTLGENISLYLRAENLAGVKYETLEGYPMPAATYMAGFTLEF